MHREVRPRLAVNQRLMPARREWSTAPHQTHLRLPLTAPGPSRRPLGGGAGGLGSPLSANTGKKKYHSWRARGGWRRQRLEPWRDFFLAAASKSPRATRSRSGLIYTEPQISPLICITARCTSQRLHGNTIACTQWCAYTARMSIGGRVGLSSSARILDSDLISDRWRLALSSPLTSTRTFHAHVLPPHFDKEALQKFMPTLLLGNIL